MRRITRLWGRRGVRGAVLVGALGWALPAYGQDADLERRKSMAREIAGQAQDAFDKKDFKTAEDLFGRADQLFHAPTLGLGLARALAANGKYVRSKEVYNRIIREDDKPGAPPLFQKAVSDAKAEMPAVAAKIASITLRVEGPPDPKVTLDGEPFPNAALGLKSPIDPGPHTVKASAPGYAAAENAFTVTEAGHAAVALTLEKDSSQPAVAVGRPADPAKPSGADATTSSGGSDVRRPLALAALGVGATGLIVGGITGAMALGKRGDLDSRCPSDVCPPSAKDDLDGFRSMVDISTVAFIVGGVGVATGAVLWFTAPKSQEKRVGVAPVIGPSSVRLTGRF